MSGRLWGRLSSHQRAVFAKKALVMKAERQAWLDEAISEATREVRAGRQVVASSSQHFDGPCKLSAAKFTASELLEFEGL
eukprot:11915600-Alexandrium_andersonii.AAC.1